MLVVLFGVMVIMNNDDDDDGMMMNNFNFNLIMIMIYDS